MIDTRIMPAFHGFRSWLDVNMAGREEQRRKIYAWLRKLEEWCKAAQEEIEALKRQSASFEEHIARTADDSEFLKDLLDCMADVERGIRHPDELKTLVETYERP